MSKLELEHAIGLSSTLPGVLHIHPDGQHLVYPACGTMVIADVLDPTNQAFLKGHNDSITCVDMSKSGRYIVTGQTGYDSDVMVWDFGTQSLVHQLSEHDHGVNCVSISPDERFFVSIGCAKDHKMIIWDLETGDIVSTLHLPFNIDVVRFIGRTVDLKGREQRTYRIMTCGADGNIDEWILDPQAGTVDRRSFGSKSVQRNFTDVAPSPDGRYVFAASQSGDVSIYSVGTAQLVQSVPVVEGEAARIIIEPAGAAQQEPDDPTERYYYRTYAAEGQATITLTVGGSDGTVATYEGHPGMNWTKLHETGVDGGVTSVMRDVTGGFTGCTTRGQVFQVSPDWTVHTIAENHTAPVVDTCFIDGSSELFVAVSEDMTARVWDLADFGVALTIRLTDRPACVCVADVCMLVGFRSGAVRCYDVETGEELWSIPDADPAGITAIAADPIAAKFITGGASGDIRQWCFRRRLLFSGREHRGEIRAIALLKDGKHMLTTATDRSMVLWDITSGARIRQYLLKAGTVNDLMLGPDGRHVLTVGSDRRLHYWTLTNDTPVTVPDAHDAEITVVCPAGDGLVITASLDASLRVWEWDERDPPRTPLQSVRVHSGAVTSVISAGETVVSAGADANLLVWRLIE